MCKKGAVQSEHGEADMRKKNKNELPRADSREFFMLFTLF